MMMSIMVVVVVPNCPIFIHFRGASGRTSGPLGLLLRPGAPRGLPDAPNFGFAFCKRLTCGDFASMNLGFTLW